MPSGSKKRKADKRKKKAKEEAHFIKSSHGNDDAKSHVEKDSNGGAVRSHDEKESDGSELSSPASQDHLSSHCRFGEGEEEEKKRGSSSVRQLVPEDESSNVTLDKIDKVIEVGEILKPDEGSVGHSVTSGYLKSVKGSHDGRQYGEILNTSISSTDNEEAKEEACNSMPEMSYHNNSFKPDVNAPKKVSRLIETAKTTEACKSVEESNLSVDSFEPVLPQVGACDDKSAPVENRVNSSADNVDFNENEVLPLSNDSVKISSRDMNFASKENDDQPLPQSDVPSVEIGNVTEHVKYSEEAPECSENQPLVALAPRMEKTTSWKSCCGLFDVLAGSSR